jgi:hypothetical protein
MTERKPALGRYSSPQQDDQQRLIYLLPRHRFLAIWSWPGYHLSLGAGQWHYAAGSLDVRGMSRTLFTDTLPFDASPHPLEATFRIREEDGHAVLVSSGGETYRWADFELLCIPEFRALEHLLMPAWRRSLARVADRFIADTDITPPGGLKDSTSRSRAVSFLRWGLLVPAALVGLYASKYAAHYMIGGSLGAILEPVPESALHIGRAFLSPIGWAGAGALMAPGKRRRVGQVLAASWAVVYAGLGVLYMHRSAAQDQSFSGASDYIFAVVVSLATLAGCFTAVRIIGYFLDSSSSQGDHGDSEGAVAS